MSRIFLVRHAQASFFEADYDRLSPLGEEQARLLGIYWARRNFSFDRVYSGPRRRQSSTGEIVSRTIRDAGRAFPEVMLMQEFDEYPGDIILQRSLPRLLESDSKIREWHQAYGRAANSAEQ